MSCQRLPAAVQRNDPGRQVAPRDALEATKNLTVPNGVLNLSTQDHQGFDQRARVMGVVRNGKFAYAGDK